MIFFYLNNSIVADILYEAIILWVYSRLYTVIRWHYTELCNTKKISGGFYNELCYIVIYSARLCFHSVGQSKAISGTEIHRVMGHYKLKNLFYGTMLLSGARHHWIADPQFTDVHVLIHILNFYRSLNKCLIDQTYAFCSLHILFSLTTLQTC